MVGDRIAAISGGQNPWHPLGASTSEAFERVFLGRACAAKGFNKHAHEVFALAEKRRDIGRHGNDLPQPFKLVRTPSSKTDPLIHQIVELNSVEEANAAFKELAGLGPGAIGAVRKLSSQIDDLHPLSKRVTQLLSDMPNTITVASLETHSKKVSKDWQQEIESLKGQVLSCDLLFRQIVKFAQKRPSAGIKIRAIRDGEGNGIQLSVELAKEATNQDETNRLWHTNCSMKLGDQVLTGHSGLRTNNLDDLATEAGHRSLKESVQKQLGPALAESNKYLRVTVSIVTFK